MVINFLKRRMQYTWMKQLESFSFPFAAYQRTFDNEDSVQRFWFQKLFNKSSMKSAASQRLFLF